MVPNWEEPIYPWLLDFIRENRITFAASNFDTTSELTLQIFGGVQQLAYYETGNKQQQGHHEQESKPKADREKKEGRSQCSP